MNDWMNTTLEAPREGGNSLLPEGLNNYTIVSADIGANQWNGRNELTLRITSAAGSGKHTIPLEPWDSAKVDTFLSIFNNSLGNIGIETEGKTPVQILATLEQDIAGVFGNVIEVNVKHEAQKSKPDGSHLREDGTPWMNAKSYINRLVTKRGPEAEFEKQPVGVAAPAGFDPSDFTSGQAADSDIPF